MLSVQLLQQFGVEEGIADNRATNAEHRRGCVGHTDGDARRAPDHPPGREREHDVDEDRRAGTASRA